MTLYFFSGGQYIRQTDSNNDFTVWGVDPGYPAPLSNWGWGTFGTKSYPPPISKRVAGDVGNSGSIGNVGKDGIDAALYSGSKCYFFAGPYYIRVTRGETGPGTVDPGYPAPISNWGWGEFGKNGIDAAFYEGANPGDLGVFYFISGTQYIVVTRFETGPGVPTTVAGNGPRPISDFHWGDFGKNGIDAALNSGVVTPPPVNQYPPGNQPPMMNAPFVSASVTPSSDPETKFISIVGKSFQANEPVNLQIKSFREGQDPNTNPADIVPVTAGANGTFTYQYYGNSGGGVCDEEVPPWQFQVQGIGQTSGKKSNVSSTGCA